MNSKARTLLFATMAAFNCLPAAAQPSTSGAPGLPPDAQAGSPGEPPNAASGGPRRAGDKLGGRAGPEEIVVTAQKRSQRLNKVGESITALSSRQLAQRGIRSVQDLVKVVPGFVYTPTSYGTPVFVLRGVGVYESGYGTSPAVSVYTDEVPIPFPIMQEGLGLDLQRVEVLKGPQGTLFGENSTGGAINYIAAKPTDQRVAGADITVERFGEVDIDAYLSGALADDLRGRLAVATNQGGAWQQSQTRSGDMLGDKDFFQGRALLDYTPSDDLKISVNLNGFYDNDQNQAPQLKFFPPSLLNPALPYPPAHYPGNPTLPTDIFTGPITPATTPRVAPNNDQSADWLPSWGDNRRNNGFVQGSVRTDYTLANDMKLTSVTSFDNISVNSYVPESGIGLPIEEIRSYGTIAAFNQELRISGDTPMLNWVAGLNYSYANSQEHEEFAVPGILFSVFDLRGLDAIGVLPSSLAHLYHLNEDTAYTRQVVNDYSAFGNVEYKLATNLSVQGGLRYTIDDRNAYSCEYYTNAANSDYGSVFEALQLLLGKSSYTPVGQGQCLVLNRNFDPAPVYNKLDQDNLSWRFGLNYTVPGWDTLLYINQSRGFKAGEVTDIGASSASQYKPIPQERLDATEAGFKAPMFGRRAQINGAAFYYDYKDKQVRGNEDDPVFGSLEQLISVPKAEIYGLEGSIDARPFTGLTTSLAGTALRSKVTSPFVAVSQNNVAGNFGGSQLPYTPKYTVTLDAQYDWSIADNYDAFVGASVLYHSLSNATFQTGVYPAANFNLPEYATVDLRAGFGPQSGAWRLSVFGRNVTNTYYLTGNYSNGNERFVYTGLPTVYGGTLSVRF